MADHRRTFWSVKANAYLALQLHAKRSGYTTHIVWSERDRKTKVSSPTRIVMCDVAGLEVEAVRVVDDLERAAEALLRWLAYQSEAA